MARILALCLLLIGLMAQTIPTATQAMQENGVMTEMVACVDCPEQGMPGGDACQSAGACASGAAALDLTRFDWPFVSPVREVRRVFGGAAPCGGCPAPPMEPPRSLI